MTETIVFGGGCFWCTEAIFKMLKGLMSAEPGYTGGKPTMATYDQVSQGNTGHIEVAKIDYDPDQLSFEELLSVFFSTHDPTTHNRQGNDIGPQYQSAIFYTTPRQKEKAEHYVGVLNKQYGDKIITEIKPLDHFYPAENYHRNYYETHKDAPYCELVIDPKIEKIKDKFQHLLNDSKG